MHGVTSKWVWMAGMAVALSVGACAENGVGDPCLPESIPCMTDPVTGVEVCGFDETESYVEASSVQCRSRLCVVHQLQGNPESVCPTDPTVPQPPQCVAAQELDDRVYCSCRCDAPDDVKAAGNFQFCGCPSGFECSEILALGGDGIRGNYCIKSSTLE